MTSPRDPREINDHIQVDFEDILGEAEATQSVACVWELSENCFKCGRNFCYNFLAMLCGMCIALYWGCEFGALAFSHTWCITPTIKTVIINCSALQKCFGNIVACSIAPFCETCGLLFSNIQIRKT